MSVERDRTRPIEVNEVLADLVALSRAHDLLTAIVSAVEAFSPGGDAASSPGGTADDRTVVVLAAD